MIAANRFAYRAARADGVTESGELMAESAEAARMALSGRGLWPISVSAQHGRSMLHRRLTSADLALGLRVLATLLESGLPVGKALAAMPDLAPPAWASALPEVERAVREGSSLAAALERAPVEMPPVVIGMIRAGEAGSGLASAVRRTAGLMEEAAAIRSAIRGALA